MDWKQRQQNALKGFRKANDKMKVDARALRITLFGKDRVPYSTAPSFPNVKVVTPDNEVIGYFTVYVTNHHTCRGGRGHRLWIDCPSCARRLPIGRVHQHFAYTHPIKSNRSHDLDSPGYSHAAGYPE